MVPAVLGFMSRQAVARRSASCFINDALLEPMWCTHCALSCLIQAGGNLLQRIMEKEGYMRPDIIKIMDQLKQFSG